MTGVAAPAVSPRRKAAPASPLTVPPRPRRVSGPARRAVQDRPARDRPDEHRGVAAALIAAVERLSRHRWLGGRAWIAFVAFALIGIVTMQLGLLKLNAGIGRALEHEALLQRENAALSIENSELSSSGHILSLATRLGMAPVAAGAVHFLQARPQIDVRLGAAALSTPAHAPATASAASSPESSAGEQSTSEAPATAASGESSTGASAPSAVPSSASAAESSPTAAAGEATGPASGQPAGSSGESAGTPASAPSSAAAGAGGGSAEGTPAGGTQAGSSG